MAATQLLLSAMLWASIGALGFAVLFQVPRHCLPFCAALGALGYGARTLLLNSSVDLILCSFAGAVLVGFAGYGLSIRYRVPSTLYTVPGIIPLVPGSIAFQSMVTLIRAIDAGPDGASTLLMSAAFDALTAGLIIFSIGVGISTPFLLFRRQKPVV